MTTAFVYKWKHLPTYRWYIGSRTKKGCHPDDGYICSSKIVKPMIEQNPEEWEREILFIGEPKETFEYESMLLQFFDAKNDPRSFNLHNTDGKCTNTGKSPSEETKEKLSKKGKERILSPEHKDNISKALIGKVRSPEHCENISKSKRGKKVSEERRLQLCSQLEFLRNREWSEEEIQNLRERMIGNTYCVGKVHSEDTKSKISQALTGKPKSEEHCKNMSLSRTGKPSPTKGIKRKPLSEEHRQKISEGGRTRIKENVICPYCNKEGAKNNMTRYHFDNCKYKE